MQSDLTQFELPEYINPSWRIGIVHTLYYAEYIQKMVEGSKEVFTDAELPSNQIISAPVFGSWEIPLLGATLAKDKRIDALIGFGIIVQGSTYHDQHLARETARAMMDIQTQYTIPFAYEILHVKSIDQVPDRVTGTYNKGKEAAVAVLHSLAAQHRFAH